PDCLRGARPRLSAREEPGAPARCHARGDAGDEPVLSMKAGTLAVALLGAMVAAPSFASGGAPDGTVRIAGDRLDLTVALEGAVPVEWRVCDPSCAGADVGATKAVRFGDADHPPIRLIIRDVEPPIDLQRLRFAAELAENERARSATFQAALPVPGVRLVKSFEVSRDGYEVVMAARLVGPNAAAFMSGRRLELEVDAGRDLLPPPAAGFAAMLERTSRVI